MDDQARWGADLDRFEGLMRRLHARAVLGSRALGVPEWDAALWQIGREWLAAQGDALHAWPASASGARPSDVYVATQVAEIGGHTALIGDFVRALGERPSHLILTDLNATPASIVSEATRLRLGLSADAVTILPGPSALDRMQQLFTRLLALRPERLFLFLHPHDPLASVVAHPEVARQLVLVHHADATPSFGLHLPGVRIIDLNPTAVAMTRLLGCAPALLPLTAPDPGPRPNGFLTRGRLVTASSGSPYKFSRRYVYGYAETVGVILSSTMGWHVHIGPLDEAMRSEVAAVLNRERVPPDRFVYIPSTPSVACTLWQVGCDLYCASFPVDGARTKIEVLASATPYLQHATRPEAERPQAREAQGGANDGLTWRTSADLTALLHRVSNTAALEEQSALMRQVYERQHHPRVFAETLARILDGGDGWDAGNARERADWAIQSMVRSLTAAMLHDTDPAASLDAAHKAVLQVGERLATETLRIDAAERALSERAAQLEMETGRIDLLRDEHEKTDQELARLRREAEQLQQAVEPLRQEVRRLGSEQDRWRRGRGLRSRLRRWLLGS